MTTLEQIAESVEQMRREITALRQQEVEIERQTTLEAQLKRIVEAMQPIGARMVVESNGVGCIQVADADDGLIWWHTFLFPEDVLKIDLTKWPSFQELVRRWESARPTPRAGDYRDRTTWTSPGRLIATEWNGRKPGREWDV